jgi:glycosyltransferase involved in cell wall biosynthesis
MARGDRSIHDSGRELWCTDAPWIDPASQPGGSGAVRFVGHVDSAELDRLYRSALCLVAPAYLEDYGLTAVEAMAYGKPLVVCRDGGNLVNFVEHGVNGLVAEPDGASIAAAVAELADDRAKAARLGAAARELAHEFTWDRTIAEFVSGIERVMS